MKKTLIFLFLGALGLCSSGQGTAYITQNTLSASPQMIRQWDNCPVTNGAHAVYFAATGNKGYLGITDVYNIIRYGHIIDNFTVLDMEVLDGVVYFCGKTYAGRALLGWANLFDFVGINATVYLDSMTFGTVTPTLNSIDNIEVYYDVLGSVYVSGYGSTSTGYVGFEYVPPTGVTPPYVTWGTLPYTPFDMTVTDQYVVFAGTRLGSDIVIHPFKKGITFSVSSAPYYSFAVGATGIEPYGSLRIVNSGQDRVVTLNYRHDGPYFMMLREFDVSGAFVNGTIPMLMAFRTTFNYSVLTGIVLDFLYDAINTTYIVLQNYEVSPADYRDVVTKIDFSNGIPSFVQSEFTIGRDNMKSISLSDSSMYVAYGYSPSLVNLFWKDKITTAIPGSCLNSDGLPMEVVNTAPSNRIQYYYGCPFTAGVLLVQRPVRVEYESITQRCHL